jgi:uncharacterized protein (TIGR03435 family)
MLSMLVCVRRRAVSAWCGAIGRAAIVVGIALGLVAGPAASQTARDTRDIAGTWQGTIQLGRTMRIVVKISKAAGGGWRGVLYSIDGSNAAEGSAIPSIVLQGTDLKFDIASIEGRYEGKLSVAGGSILGVWTQGSGSVALNLTRATDEAAWAIPEPDKAMAVDADPAYEVVTIKPSDPTDRGRGFQTRGRHVRAANESVNDMISFAYGVHTKQIVGGPAWFSTDHYFVDGVPDVPGEPNLAQFRSIIRKVLADRFGLRVHNEKKELSVYALMVAKGGPKMTRSVGNPNGPPDDNFSTSAWLKETDTTMADFAKAMQMTVLDRPVVDQTGLEGRWDFLLKWTPDESQFTAIGVRIQPRGDDPSAPPGLFTAIQEQIGLRLEAVKAPTDVLVVDSVERPSEN